MLSGCLEFSWLFLPPLPFKIKFFSFFQSNDYSSFTRNSFKLLNKFPQFFFTLVHSINPQNIAIAHFIPFTNPLLIFRIFCQDRRQTISRICNMDCVHDRVVIITSAEVRQIFSVGSLDEPLNVRRIYIFPHNFDVIIAIWWNVNVMKAEKMDELVKNVAGSITGTRW